MQLAQLGRGVDVDLAADRDDGAAVLLAGRQGRDPRLLPGRELVRTVRPGARRCPFDHRRHRPRVTEFAGPPHITPDGASAASPPLCQTHEVKPCRPGVLPTGRHARAPTGRRARPRGPAAPPRACCRPARRCTRRLAGVGADPQLVERCAPGASTRPWRHQVVAAERPTPASTSCVATGTASGKSLAYQLPALSRDPRGPRAARTAGRHGALPRPDQGAGPRPARAVCVARPAACAPRRTTATPRARSGTGRATTPSTSSPTPTCCTARCCPGTHRWSRFSRSLQYVVVDECHHYRGVFGAHVAQVLRRLRRVVRDVRRPPDVRARLGDRRASRRSRRRG